VFFFNFIIQERLLTFSLLFFFVGTTFGASLEVNGVRGGKGGFFFLHYNTRTFINVLFFLFCRNGHFDASPGKCAGWFFKFNRRTFTNVLFSLFYREPLEMEPVGELRVYREGFHFSLRTFLMFFFLFCRGTSGTFGFWKRN